MAPGQSAQDRRGQAEASEMYASGHSSMGLGSDQPLRISANVNADFSVIADGVST
jgi:hypothetical protein